MAPAFILGQLCDINDLDGTLFIARDRDAGDGLRERQGRPIPTAAGARASGSGIDNSLIRINISARDSFRGKDTMAHTRGGRVTRRRLLQGAAPRAHRLSDAQLRLVPPLRRQPRHLLRARRRPRRTLARDRHARGAQDQLPARGLREPAHRGRDRGVPRLRHHRLQQRDRHRRAGRGRGDALLPRRLAGFLRAELRPLLRRGHARPTSTAPRPPASAR